RQLPRLHALLRGHGLLHARIWLPAARRESRSGSAQGLAQARYSARRASGLSRNAAGARDVVAIREPPLESRLDHLDHTVLQRRRRVADHHLPGIQAVTAFYFLVHPLELEKLRIDPVDPYQRMLPDGGVDFGI